MCFRSGAVFFLLGEAGQGDTKDFLSLSKKVLVTLIRFLCSFFSAARRTNPEAPPQLSSLLACRYGRRRGLRNSLCSDSPRPFSSVFLAASPPDKGGIGDCALACILTPSPYGHSPYILLRKTQGESVIPGLSLPLFINPSVTACHLPYILLCKTQGRSVILGLLLSLFFNPSVLRPPPLYFAVQNTGGECDTRFVAADVFSTPPSFGHLPYILLRKTQGRG